ncbi:MAG: gamma-glutamylcyclotransferase [Gemmataceae bacterium]|nr:gamma-glutamylcyclotransferase [Gemmataceae bacterium]
MNHSCPYLFVYGTLRRESAHPLAALLAARARLVGAGRAPGRLYDLGAYPGMTAVAAPQEWVRGEVYELTDPEALLAMLDHYEGCDPDEPEQSLFARLPAAVTLEDGSALTAWAYFYRGPLEGAQPIPSGDYFEPA